MLAELRLGGLDEWMGETGSAWGGGAPGLSDKYVAGFLYDIFYNYVIKFLNFFKNFETSELKTQIFYIIWYI